MEASISKEESSNTSSMASSLSPPTKPLLPFSSSKYLIPSVLLLLLSTTLLLLFSSSHSIVLCPHTPLPSTSISFNSIPPIPPLPSDPFSSLRANNWLILPALPSNSPLPSLPSFQLLAVATSLTPPSFHLSPPSIFLSLSLQSQLSFRSLHHLPPHSPLRKSIAYLYAIQHGAKLILDSHPLSLPLPISPFDLTLNNPQILLQYSHHLPNRTLLNPYIHFGQPSVWPRGLPLHRVPDISPEPFYTQIYGGRQFIQQGLFNGLPDVDSPFYFTRKSSKLEPFDIRFDPHAPTVALPQGTMVPLNSMNTLFHSQAFWGLMLPVSVSPMASDVIRGYWAQRLLWEIDGYVAVYPPTAHRFDDVGVYHSFEEERDIHVNVGRLVEFLLSWRSNKPTLFERALDLSYAMAEEGFWSEADVRFTADWLKDLLAVGYQQPRLMSLELGRPRAVIGHGDRKEFIPKKLPTVHLGVEEVGSVSSEIGDLIKWRKSFGNVVLVMHDRGGGFVDRTAVEWRLLYGRVFKTVIILSGERNVDLMVEYGQLHQAYKYLPKIFSRYSGADGFIFLQDNMILNYWNLLDADKSKLWITNKVPESWVTVTIDSNSSQWYSKQAALVKQAVAIFPLRFQSNFNLNFKDGDAREKLTICGSEIFYVPRRFVGDFIDLVSLVGNLDVHHKVAVPMLFMAMDSPQNFDPDTLSKILYIKGQGGIDSDPNSYSVQALAVYPLNISSKAEFVKLVRVMSSADQLLKELV